MLKARFEIQLELGSDHPDVRAAICTALHELATAVAVNSDPHAVLEVSRGKAAYAYESEPTKKPKATA